MDDFLKLKGQGRKSIASPLFNCRPEEILLGFKTFGWSGP
jgi:hypothetical protein